MYRVFGNESPIPSIELTQACRVFFLTTYKRVKVLYPFTP